MIRPPVNWLEQFNAFANRKVLLMLSGGKDSTCCLAVLKEAGVQVETVHFRHAWDWENSHQEAHRAAKHFEVAIHDFDFSPEFFEIVANSLVGRPCRYCKPVMYQKAMDLAVNQGFGWIAVGDNASDTIIDRLTAYEKERGNENLVFTEYLDCIERGIPLREGLKVLRPLIRFSDLEIEALLKQRYQYTVKKNNETGDKYFGYWREGCPIQYTDPGFQHTEESLRFLQATNLAASNYAGQHGFRASLHYPSNVIVTIPPGHEEEIQQHLRRSGFSVDDTRRIQPPWMTSYQVQCSGVAQYYLSGEETFHPLALRFAERVRLNPTIEHSWFQSYGLTFIQLAEGGRVIYRSDKVSGELVIDIDLAQPHTGDPLEAITFEVFKPVRIVVS